MLQGKPDRVSDIIRVENLVKRYKKSERNAVDGISFTVAPGEVFALLGPNGAGKTTTISILTTTLQHTSGELSIAGFDPARQASEVRSRIGVIFQNPSLDLNLTAEENVRLHAVLYGLYPFRPSFRLMPAAYKRQCEELSAVLGISDEMFRPVKTFSGGMKRKLEIVRGLIHVPDILFLDEPTIGLDPASRRSLWAYLKDQRARLGTTVFLTTHYLEEAEDADTVCIINEGRVVSLGSPASVKSDLSSEYVIVDADDRTALVAELARIGFEPASDPPFRLELNGRSVHEVLRAIETPLTFVNIHTPSLEDAYLEIVGQE